MLQNVQLENMKYYYLSWCDFLWKNFLKLGWTKNWKASVYWEEENKEVDNERTPQSSSNQDSHHHHY